MEGEWYVHHDWGEWLWVVVVLFVLGCIVRGLYDGLRK